jgi:peptidoglycan/xylan/chitin deacetylase (PgdA/CDA1 family)
MGSAPTFLPRLAPADITMTLNSIPLNYAATAVSRKRRAVRSVLRAVSRLAARRTETRTIVLMYHSIGYSAYAVRPEDFEAQMRYLKAHARVVALDAIISGRDNDTVAPLTCAITFDDGYAGVYEYAYPILRDNGFEAVLYVTTSALDRGCAQHPRKIPGFFPGEPTLTWVQAREMSKAGITVGSHLCHHLDMRQLSQETGMEELARSKDIISQKLAAPCKHFAYPFGFFNARNVGWVRELGYETAVTVRHSLVPDNLDPLRIPRMGLGPENSWADFEGMLRGDLDYLLILRKVWQMLGLPV